MRFLVIGLGSMGKRRVRNLIALNENEIAGYDPRESRREQCGQYNITLYDDFEKALNEFNPNVFIISTPPNLHMDYAYIAYEKKISSFIEASVVDEDRILDLYHLIENTDIVILPSCTMQYYSGPKKIKELIKNNVIGKPLNFNYHSGQYLPDWHPWEKIEDFYVSKREMGGCREIVPFELTWLNELFGNPKPLSCVKRKLTDLAVDIDDIYHCLLSYPNGLIGNLTVEVISQPKATRELRIIGSLGQIVFSSDSNSVKYINTDMDEWKIINFNTGSIESNYINPEEPYIEEMKDFISAVRSKKSDLFNNSLLKDYKVLETLNELESLSENSIE